MSDELFLFGPVDDDDDLPYLEGDDDMGTLQLVDANSIQDALAAAPYGGGMLPLSPLESALVRGISTGEIAQRVQRALLRIYPPDVSVLLVNEDEEFDQDPFEFPLSELAAQEFDGERSIILPRVEPVEHTRVIEGLQQIIARLRAPGGCPWDREQTHQSLTRYMIEEAYETVQAIETAGPSELAEELGDVLLQILLHTQIAEENGVFTLEDVFEILAAKMVRRHPHVFGDRSVESAGEVVTAWDQIKQQERATKSDDDAASVFDSIPPSLPALSRIETMLRRAESHGMDIEQISGRVASTMNESGAADEAQVAEQLSTIVRDARERGVDAEGALRRWTECFEKIANESAPQTDER
jgi:tetrapyrrole methylase family protein/MazG family protein